MNAANLRATADAIERSATYDQREWTHECGTPSCIAGHAAWLTMKPHERFLHDLSGYICSASGVIVEGADNRARDFLSLTEDEAYTLFCGSPALHWPKPFATYWRAADSNREAEKAVAVAYLRHLADEAERSKGGGA